MEKGPEKGKYNLECYRAACKNGKAVYFNHSTRMYYCRSCAFTLNEANETDAWRLFGHDLCTIQTTN